MKILETGLAEHTLALLSDYFRQTDSEIVSVPETEVSQYKQELETADVILLGENTSNPIKLAQLIYNQLPHLSIVLISDPASYQKIKQSLLFTPFLGPTITSVNSAAGKGLIDVIHNHGARTRQRKSFTNIKSALHTQGVGVEQNYELITSDFLSRMYEAAPIGLALLNRRGIILSFNPFATRLFDKSERGVLGTPFDELFTKDKGEQFREFFRQKNHRTLKDTFVFTNVRGEEKHLQVSLEDLSRNGKEYCLALITDVSEQIKAQRLIQENARRIQFIIDSLPDLAWTAQPNGRVDFLNRRWFELTGIQKQEDWGKVWERVVHADDFPITSKAWEEAIRNKTPYQVKCRFWDDARNTYRWHLTRAYPVRNDEGIVYLWVGTSTDIQGLQETEEALQEAKQHLENKNKELSLAYQDIQLGNEELAAANEELAAANEEIQANNDELHRANQQLSRVNEDLDNFVYTASHDLKSPIVNVEGLTNLLAARLRKKADVDTSITQIVEMISVSIARFKRTIYDLTEVSRIQRLSSDEAESVQVADIVDDVLFDLQPQISETEAELEVDIPQGLSINFARKNLKSILYNLLTNAVKYRSPERKPQIQLSFEETEDYTILMVSDNGLGFDIAKVDRIFSMFQRLHAHVEGSGIGLYMVKKIIENAEGKIEVESEPGKGSRFRVYFRKQWESFLNESQF